MDFNLRMQPNTTQVPNHILDEELPRLKEVELKVLLVIVRQTLGWVEDVETGRRKEKDWISVGQFEKKTGTKRWAIGKAITTLIKADLIEAMDGKGNVLTTPHERQLAGSRIFYRLKTRAATLFDKQPKTRVKNTKDGGSGKFTQGVGEIHAPQNSRTTKETDPTKETLDKTPAEQAPREGEPRKTWTEKRAAGEKVDDATYLIDLFADLNPNHYRLFSQTSQREAAKRMIGKHTIGKMEGIMAFLKKHHGERFCPTITTPIQLEQKLGDLIAFYKRQESNQNQVAIIR